MSYHQQQWYAFAVFSLNFVIKELKRGYLISSGSCQVLNLASNCHFQLCFQSSLHLMNYQSMSPKCMNCSHVWMIRVKHLDLLVSLELFLVCCLSLNDYLPAQTLSCHLYHDAYQSCCYYYLAKSFRTKNQRQLLLLGHF